MLPRPGAQGSELQKQVGQGSGAVCPFTLGGSLDTLAISMAPQIRSKVRTPELSGSAAQQVSGGLGRSQM